MKDPNYWKIHYVLKANADEIEKHIKITKFTSNKQKFELIHFRKSKNAPNILISPGSGGHSYVFVELAYYMYLKGYNVFIMPKQGDYTINQLMTRHSDALNHIANNFNDRIGVYAEGFGGYTAFYLALVNSPMKSIVLENAPAILTEDKFQEAIMQGKGAAQRRKLILPFARFLVKIFPNIKLPISIYLDFKELIDMKRENRILETKLVEGFLNDPDFDTKYSLSTIMSLISTPPSKPLSNLKIPTMFIVAVRGVFPSYIKDLYKRLPPVKKKIIEVDDGVYWMCSHKEEAAKVICRWFDETLWLV